MGVWTRRWVVVGGLLGVPMWAVAQAAGGAQTPSGTGAAPRYQSNFNTAPALAPLPKPEAITQNGTVVEDVIARVNDQIINRSDMERSQAQLVQELQQGNASATEREDKQRDLLRDMIDQQLLISKAKELGLNADAEVIRRMDEIRKQNHLDTMEDLEKAARQQGVNFEDFKANIRNGILTQQVVREEVGRRLQLTQGQEQAFFDAHKAEFAQPEQVRLSEILIPLPADATEAQVAQAQEKASGVAEKIKAGSSFEELAKANSGGQTAAQGGDLGEFKRGALAKVLEDQTFVLKPGESTAPIRTRQGFVILKVTDHQQGGVPALKDVEPQVQEAMYMQQMAPALRTYLTKLREEAYIDIKPGYVDTGASAGQTKPVFTAYAPPAPKKKLQQKGRFERMSGMRAVAPAAPGKISGLTPLPSGTGPAQVPDATGKLPETASADVPPGPASSGAAGTASPGTAPAAADVQAAATGKTRASARVSKDGKPKKIKREKVRFGQAPRNSLPAGPEETPQVGSDTGSGAASAAVTPGGVMAQGTAGAGQAPAPGTAIAPTESTTQISATSDADPLAPKPAATGKTRFAAKDKEFREEKAAAKKAKAKEKVVAAATGPTPVENATQRTQAAPLGLNGDTAKKKKAKREKGAPKERLQDKKPDTTQPAPVAPTVNPALSPGAPASAGDRGAQTAKPSSDQTTVPPVSTPAPVGAPPQGQALPPTGAPETTPNGTQAPPPPQ